MSDKLDLPYSKLDVKKICALDLIEKSIATFNDYQKNIANKSKEKFQQSFHDRIVTEVTKADIFYKAEEYHQNYIQKSKN